MEKQLWVVFAIYFLGVTAECTPPQDCSASEFSCGNNDPCAPTICNSTITKYPGNTDRKYMQCEGANLDECKQYMCPQLTTFDPADQRCEGDDGTEARCYFARYDCSDPDSNPCYPSKCSPFSPHFPGKTNKYYITCGPNEECIPNQCPPGQRYNLIAGVCEPNSELNGCEDTFTYRNETFIASWGRHHDWYNTTKEQCRADCLAKSTCVGYNFWNTDKMPGWFSLTPRCTLIHYYGLYVQSVPYYIESFERDGCTPDVRKKRYSEWVRTTDW